MTRMMSERGTKSRQQWLILEFVSPGPPILSLAKIQLQVAGWKRQLEKCWWHLPDDHKFSAVSPYPMVLSQKYKLCIVSAVL